MLMSIVDNVASYVLSHMLANGKVWPYSLERNQHTPPGVCLFIRVGDTVDHIVDFSLPLQLLSVMKI